MICLAAADQRRDRMPQAWLSPLDRRPAAEYGLYTAIVHAIIAALFGSSFHLISGPTRRSPSWCSPPVSPHAGTGQARNTFKLVLTMTFIGRYVPTAARRSATGALVNFNLALGGGGLHGRRERF